MYQICPGCSAADEFWAFTLFHGIWAISGPELLFLEEVPSSARGYLLVSFPIQGTMGHSRAPTLQFILHFSFGEVDKLKNKK